MPPDLSHWIPLAEAARQMQISERTARRMIARGELQATERARPGRRPETVIHPADVAAHRPALIAFPTAAPPAAELAPADPHRSGGPAAIAAAMLAALDSAARAAPPPALWLTIDQAAEYSGLSASFLRRAIRVGRLKAIRDRATKVRRADLDTMEP